MIHADKQVDHATAEKILENYVSLEMMVFRRLVQGIPPVGEELQATWATGHVWQVDASGEIDWDYEFETQLDSNRMWLYSLVTVGQLVAHDEPDSRGMVWAEKIVRSFLRRCEDDDFVQSLTRISSSDHSAATRVNALVIYLQHLRETVGRDWDHIGDVIASIRFWCEFLSGKRGFAKNNHGIMAAKALLNGAQQLSGLEEAEELIQTAEYRIRYIVELSFDDDGMCFENTVGYHNFNLSLYRQIIGFLSNNRPDSSLLDFLNGFMRKGEEALAIAIRQDRTIPPLGDSPVYAVRTPSVNRSKSFKDSGLTIIKNDDLYLSFVCGSRSEAHKQQDDTSITLVYRGSDIITDGGSYNYDQSDRFRLAVQSSYGHSGIFPKAIEGYSRRELLKAWEGGHFAETKHFFEKGEFSVVQGVAGSVDGSIAAIRTILVSWPNEVVIVDAVDHDDTLPESGWVNRLLFGPVLNVNQLDGGRLDFDEGKVRGSVLVLHSGARELYRGVDDEVVKGWCSVQNGKILPTDGVDSTSISSTARFVTAIKLGEHARSLEDFSALSRRFAVGVWDPVGECAQSS